MTEKKIKVERARIADLRENPLNARIFNDVGPEKYEALKEYIRRQGLLKPIIVNRDNVILAGHVRYRICKELGHEYIPIQRVKLGDSKREEEFLIKDNLLTRALTPIEVARAGIHLEHIARKWQRTGKVLRNVVAKRLGVSPFQYVKAKTILNNGDTDLIRRVDRGDLSVARAYTQIRQEKQKAQARKEAISEQPRFRLVHEDPMAVLGNFRPETCEAMIAEPPAGYDPLWIDLAVRALKDTGHLAILTETNFGAIAGAQEAGLKVVAPICVLGKTHEEGRIIHNHRLFTWLSKDPKPRIPVDRLSTVWDLRTYEDVNFEMMKRILQLVSQPAEIVVHLFGDNRMMEDLTRITGRNIFAVQPEREVYLREKLNA